MKKNLFITTGQNQVISEKVLAETVIKNAVRVGEKLIAEVPIQLLKTDNTYQRVIKNNAQKLFDNWDMKKCGALSVSYRGGFFYVMDGGHRLLVAQLKNISHLVCEIYTGLTIEDEAKWFGGQISETTRLTTHDTFKANLVWGDKTDTTIKQVCDEYKVSIETGRECRNLRSITSARRIVLNGGKEALTWVFDVISNANWEEFNSSYGSHIMDNLFAIKEEHKDTLGFVENNLIDTLSKINPVKLETAANLKYSNIPSRKSRIKNILEYIANGNDINDILIA